MKIILNGTFLFALAALCSQCNRITYTAETFPEENYLAFGQGGGFAGSLTTHYLLSNGQLFISEGIEGAKISDGKIGKRKAKKMLKRYQEEIRPYDFQEPGNLYSFLEYVAADTTYEQQWGRAGMDVPEPMLLFFKDLQLLSPYFSSNTKSKDGLQN
jgi:hypothetical protein